MFFLCTKNDLFDILSKMLHLTVFFYKRYELWKKKILFPLQEVCQLNSACV